MGVAENGIQVGIDQVRGFLYPSPEERAAAYELLVELSTRISTTELATSGTSIRESLSSLDAMFEITREILRKHGAAASKGTEGNLSLAVIAVRVLNEVLRPVAARWNPALADYEARRAVDAPSITPFEWERRWPQGTQCRSELSDLRAAVRAYIDTLGRIAGASAVADAVLRPPSSIELDPWRLRPSTGPTRTPSSVVATERPRERMVSWISPLVGMKTLAAVRRATDPPRLDAARTDEPAAVFEAGPGEDFWFDYVADMGDAFDGTAPIAWLVGCRRISIPVDLSDELPAPPAFMDRAALLVFGGDEVYPYAARAAYENQTVLPYRMGWEPRPLDAGDEDETQPTLVTIPGNHDWLGGIRHFDEVFTVADGATKTFADHWKVVQRRRYWSVKLPQGWWLWGIDTGLTNALPDEQFDYFTDMAELLTPGDRVLLCTPVPLWQLRQKHPRQYTELRRALDPLIAAKHARLPLCLSGDSHFFAHFERVDSDSGEDHITAGGGGAFSHPTHNIPERIPLAKGNAEFKLTSRWPLPADSRALAPHGRRLLDRQYTALLAVMVGLHLGFALLVATRFWALAWSSETTGSARHWANWTHAAAWTSASPWGLALLLVVAGAGVLTMTSNSTESNLDSAARLYGFLIGASVGVSLFVVAVARRLIDPDQGWALVAGSVIVGGIVSTLGFLLMMQWANTQIKAGDNLVFSMAHSTRFKHFIRFRINQQGDLTAYVVGIDPVGKGWYRSMTAVDRPSIPSHDDAGIPRIHYVWGKTFPKFVPGPMPIAVSASSDQDADADHAERVRAALVVNVCAALIEAGHSLLYGGMPDGSYTTGLREIERRRHSDNPNHTPHLINYVADYLWPPEASDRIEFHDGSIRSVRVQRPAPSGETPQQRKIRDLTAMRERITRDARARIVIGGRRSPREAGNERVAPGVIEEAYLAVEAGLPLFVAGGFGGAARWIAEALLDRIDLADLDAHASRFGGTPTPRPDGTPGADFLSMVKRFNSIGLLRNGLSDGENRELLTTNDAETASELILRGVSRIASRRSQ